MQRRQAPLDLFALSPFLARFCLVDISPHHPVLHAMQVSNILSLTAMCQGPRFAAHQRESKKMYQRKKHPLVPSNRYFHQGGWVVFVLTARPRWSRLHLGPRTLAFSSNPYFTMVARELISLMCLGSATAFVSPFIGRQGMQSPKTG